MYADERQALLTRRLSEVGRLRVAQLATELRVSTETVRRDIAALEKTGVARRVHGGAVLAQRLRALEPGVDERTSLNADRKARIAQAALSFLPETSGSVIFDAGTSVHQLVAALPADCQLTAITHSVHAAWEISRYPEVKLQLVGGTVRGATAAAVGADTVDAFRHFGCDVAFVGTNGFSPQRGFTTPDADEAAVKSAIVRAADTVVMLADSSKFGAEFLIRFADLSNVDVIITDSDIDPGMADSIRAREIELVTA